MLEGDSLKLDKENFLPESRSRDEIVSEGRAGFMDEVHFSPDGVLGLRQRTYSVFDATPALVNIAGKGSSCGGSHEARSAHTWQG